MKTQNMINYNKNTIKAFRRRKVDTEVGEEL